MSVLAICVLTAIVVAFLIFGAVLAWGEWQTRDLGAAGKSEKRRAEVAEALMKSANAIAVADRSVGHRKTVKN